MSKVSPTVGYWQLFQNKMTNARQMPGGDGHAWNLLSHYLVKLPLISGVVYYIIFCHSCRKSFSLATISINVNPLLTNRWKDKRRSVSSFTERSVTQRPFFPNI